MTLEVRWVSHDTIEVKEILHGFLEHKVTYWYKNLTARLVSSLGKKDEKPSRPMTDAEYDWTIRYQVPLIKAD